MAERPLTGATRKDGAPLSLKEYEESGGYRALKKALNSMSPGDVQKAVTDAALRGRGGAGFPTGQKWSFVPHDDGGPRPRYIISNSDEMEPGAFKDRFLMERNPHQLIEGLILGGYAVGADVGYIFLRWAYQRSEENLKRAIEEARAAGYWGERVLGSDFSIQVRLHVSAGRYICGEETALISALEGRRAIPRNRPPYPQASGLWGRPTVVNNAETLANVPHIVEHGPGWFISLSTTACGGTKMYTVSGRVRRPGVWELPMGTPMRELIEEHAGGMREGYGFRAVIPGGASTEFVLDDKLDVRMDFDEMKKAGSRLGTGTMIVLDDRTCPVGLVANIEKFFARESCGWCTPCREGLPWVAKLLDAIENGQGEPEDIEILKEQTKALSPGRTFCVLAPGAMEPLQSALDYFREDFDRHIREKRCPYR